jgi:dipeptidase
MGCLPLRPTLKCDHPGLLGTDLTRLALERSRTARQAVDLLTGLVERYGQGAFSSRSTEAERDNAFLIADPTEAYVVETAGHHWVYQEIQEVRAVSNVRVIRQDWDRISHGLASYAISQGWWPDDGSKLDFAGALGDEPGLQASAFRRWGRITLCLMEQNGHIDTPFARRLLGDECENSLQGQGPLEPKRTVREMAAPAVATGFVVALTGEPAQLPMAWSSLGTACGDFYFPVYLDGELPAAFSSAVQQPDGDNLWSRMLRLDEQLEHDPERRALSRDSFARLQARFDQEAEEFTAEALALKQRGALTELQRQATLFMEHNLERYEGVLTDSLRTEALVAVDG